MHLGVLHAKGRPLIISTCLRSFSSPSLPLVNNCQISKDSRIGQIIFNNKLVLIVMTMMALSISLP